METDGDAAPCRTVQPMPTIKRASKFMDRQGAGVLALSIAAGAALFALLCFVSEPFWQKLVGLAGFIGVAAALVWFQRKTNGNFRCPDCGGPTGPPLATDGKPGTPLLRPCKPCDVLWQVGVESD